jgi:hypothetical protein
MTVTAGTGVFTFAATSGTKTINTAGVTFDRPFTFNGVGGTWQLQAALTSGSTRTCTLTNGALNLNGYTFTCGAVNASNSNVRTLAFGSAGKFVLLNSGVTVWTTGTVTNLTVTGTPLVELTYAGSTGTRTIAPGILTESTAISFSILAGSDTIVNSGTGATYKNLTFSGFTGTLTLTNSLSTYGNVTLSSGMTFSATGGMTFRATSGTQTVTTAGVSFGAALAVNAPGGTVALADALTTTLRTITLTSGTFTTNGYAVTIASFAGSGTTLRTLNLGASTFTLGSSGTSWDIADPTNMTLNAGTSSIVFTATTAGGTFQGGGLTYYDVTFPGTFHGWSMAGDNTYRNLTALPIPGPGRRAITFAGTHTITGTLSCSGSAGNVRQRITASNALVPPTISVAAVATLSDVDFSDVNITGAAAPFAGTRLGDLGGNTGVVFAGGKTVYWNQPAGGNWSDNAWALSSGGAVSTNNFPLGQDTVILDNTGVGASSTIVMDYGWAMGPFDTSALTNAVTISWNTFANLSVSFCGDIDLTSAVTFSQVAGQVVFRGDPTTGNMGITSSGVIWPQTTISLSPTGVGVVTLDDDFTCTTTFVCYGGAIDLNGNDLTTNIFDGTNATLLPRSIAFNSGQINVTGSGTTVWAAEDLTNFSYTGTPTVNFTYAGSVGTRLVNNGATAGATEFNVVDINVTAGTDIFTITTASSVGSIDFTGFTGVGSTGTSSFIYGNLTLGAGQTIAASGVASTLAATSGVKTITSNGVTFDRGLRFSGIGGTWELQDALVLGSTRTVALDAGTLTTNGYSVTCGKFGATAATAAGDRTLNLGASTFTCTGTSTTAASWQAEDGAYTLTINPGTSTIVLAEAFTGLSTQNFGSLPGEVHNYYNLSYTGGQPSTITGNNTFNSITVSVYPITLSFEAGSTQTVNQFNVSGTAGNLTTLNSSTPGSQWYLAKNTGGKVLVSYVSITDSAATPAGYWFAPTSQGNVDGGNNTGWNFGAAGGAGGFLPFF